MKRGTSFILLAFICISEVSFILPFVEYQINYDYISEVLCINKSDSTSKCKGKCYLNEQLKSCGDTNNQNNKPPTFDLERIPLVIAKLEYPKFGLIELIFTEQQFAFNCIKQEVSITPPIPPPQF